MCNMERIGLTASEDILFDNVDGRMTDGRRMPVHVQKHIKELKEINDVYIIYSLSLMHINMQFG